MLGKLPRNWNLHQHPLIGEMKPGEMRAISGVSAEHMEVVK